MFVQVQGVQREGFQGVWRAGRFWPSGAPQKIEVVPGEPEPVVEDVLENGKKVSTRLVPDPTKISRAHYELLKADHRVRILQDGETDATISKAVLEAAKKSAAEAGSKVAALEAENAGLKEANEALAARIAEIESAAVVHSDADDHSSKSHGKGSKR